MSIKLFRKNVIKRVYAKDYFDKYYQGELSFNNMFGSVAVILLGFMFFRL